MPITSKADYLDELGGDDYWARQFPEEVLAKLAENGRQCTDAQGLPLEDADPVPVVKLFLAAHSAWWLLGFTYPNDPDRAYALASLFPDIVEFGDVSIAELKTLRGGLGLPIERDICFKGDRPMSGYIDGGRP